MMVIVDTSVWSLALRRNKRRKTELAEIMHELTELIGEFRAAMLGPIRQEILSGIRTPEHFSELMEKLRAFDDTAIETEDYEKAAEFFSLCRGKGIQGSHIDFLICAVAFRKNLSIFTTDKDFELYAEHLPITLHAPRKL